MLFYIGELYVNITPGNIHIHDSYKIKTVAEMNRVIDIILLTDNAILKTRSRASILREWKAHNICYKLHLFRKSSMHTDIEAKQGLFHKICYLLLSLFMVK